MNAGCHRFETMIRFTLWNHITGATGLRATTWTVGHHQPPHALTRHQRTHRR
ncbi:hypothetical protein ABIE67_000489 [Streptomyces sp. V4I8]